MVISNKIYSVTFLKYANTSRSVVYNPSTGKSINVKEPFLIRESDLSFYEGFGDGFRNLSFVGYLNNPDEVVIQ